VLALLVGCKHESSKQRDLAEEPKAARPTQGGSYSDLVKQTQTGSATETRSELACAAAIPVPPRPDFKPPPGTAAGREKRHDRLSSLSGAALVREATDDELVGIVIDRLVKSLDDPMTMSPAERDIWLWNDYSGEVFNGGHHQFFFNSSGDAALETRGALEHIGLGDVLKIYDCALTAFPASRPSHDGDERNNQLARWGDNQFKIFERLDSAFYAITVSTPAVGAYVRTRFADMPNVQKPHRSVR
jgi:hypothetical protein